MRYYLIAGEASGDLHASNLMKALKAADKAAEFRFYGGDMMNNVGGTLVRHYKEMSYMGFIPVLMHARTILKNMRQCKEDVIAWKPDVLILVDYPGFNLPVAKYVKTHSEIPVYYYISPKIWAWKEHRIKQIKLYVDELFSILPFEVDFFERKHGYKIHYVGNPCVDAVESYKASKNIKDVSAGDEKPAIAVLAGSRTQEIKKNLGRMLLAASRFGQYRLVIAGAPNMPIETYKRFIPDGVDAEVEFGKTYEIAENAVAALVTSGTATLETALLNTPQVVCYYISGGGFWKLIKKLVVKVKFISLVNLICDKEVVKELIANDMNVERVASELKSVLPGGDKRERMLGDYKEMRRILGPAGASERTAEIIVKLLNKKKA